MLKLLLRFIIIALALLAIAHVVPGILVTGFWAALLAAVLWGIVGITIKPLIHILALPVTIVTLGLFAFIINALMFWLVAGLVPGFTVMGFVPALLGSLMLTVVNWVVHKAL